MAGSKDVGRKGEEEGEGSGMGVECSSILAVRKDDIAVQGGFRTCE